jgi:hypothetical protein
MTNASEDEKQSKLTPGIEGIVERLARHELFMNRKQFDAQITRFAEELALFLHVLVWPTKHLRYGTFLAKSSINARNLESQPWASSEEAFFQMFYLFDRYGKLHCSVGS